MTFQSWNLGIQEILDITKIGCISPELFFKRIKYGCEKVKQCKSKPQKLRRGKI